MNAPLLLLLSLCSLAPSSTLDNPARKPAARAEDPTTKTLSLSFGIYQSDKATSCTRS
jgi:hypothetical protein